MKVYSLKLFIILLTFIFAFNLESSAQDAEVSFSYNRDLRSFEVYDSKNYLTGDWGGLRSRLNELGITPIASYYITILGNPAGGKKRHSICRFAECLFEI
jgi:carbohydrate-selective porin OprB